MLDVLLILLIAVAALYGWRAGLITSVLTAIGWFAGLSAGLWATPRIVEEVRPETGSSATAVVTVVTALVLASVLAGLLGRVGVSLVRITSWRPVRFVDAAAGAAAVAVAMSFAAWAVPNAARPYLDGQAGSAVEDSRVWSTLNERMPDPAREVASGLARSVEASPFPQLFDYPASTVDAAPPDESVVTGPGVERAAQGVVKVRAALSCDRGSVGSGWVVSDERVVTNAHVVAGADRVSVQVGGTGPRLQATVVAFDTEQDLAVLRVDDLTARPLQRASLEPGANGVVAGFPRGGAYHLSAARVLGEGETRTRDVYGDRQVTRDMVTLETTVVEGNSGGPLLTPSGAVAGTIFARAADNGQRGFAIADDSAGSLLDRASDLDDPVGTGSCLAEQGA